MRKSVGKIFSSMKNNKIYTLGELLTPLNKGPITKNELDENGKYPVMNSSRDIFGFLNRYNNDSKAVIITSHGANAGFVSFYDGKFYAGPLCFPYEVIDDKAVNIKYIYYYMKNFEEIHMKKTVLTGSIPYINRTSLDLLPVNLPSIDVQNEIVEVLDKFTLLEAELEAELEARVEQFKYYKDEVYSSIDKKHYKRIKEIGSIERGNGLSKNDFVDEGVPCIHYGQIYTTFNTWTDKTISYVSEELAGKLKEVNHGDIIIAVTSETYEDVCKPLVWMGNESIVTGGHTAILRHNQNPKFIAYYLETYLFTKVKYKLSRGVKVIEVRPFDLLDVEIPVPPIDIQNMLVEKLDSFANLINNLENGLPKEIELRRQQYEYYRNKLLTFESEV